jgi:hypothetical protein
VLPHVGVSHYNSRLLTYAGWGHTAYGRSACSTTHIDRYLLTGALPPRGTICPANPNPFLAAATQRSTTPTPLIGLPTLKRWESPVDSAEVTLRMLR